jgi:hypothetical protein
MSIREANVLRMVEEKRAEAARARAFRFRAGPIAPATADLGLFARIMARNEERRRLEHDRKAAYAAAHFKPFTVVTAHCEEAAARVAAKRAEAALALERELAASVVFTANASDEGNLVKHHTNKAPKPNKSTTPAKAGRATVL